MTKYLATFIGRKVGAIGIRYQISVMVEAANKEAAELRLYDSYEHISNLELKEQEEENQ